MVKPPAVLPKPKNLDPRPVGEEEDDEEEEDSPTRARAMPFKLLGRDAKGRIEARQLLVPQAAPMAIRLAEATAAAREERQRLKEKVLQIDRVIQDQNNDQVLRFVSTPMTLQF